MLDNFYQLTNNFLQCMGILKAPHSGPGVFEIMYSVDVNMTIGERFHYFAEAMLSSTRNAVCSPPLAGT